MTTNNIEDQENPKEGREHNDRIVDLTTSVDAVENQGGITDPSDVQILDVTEDIKDSDWDISVCVYGPPVDIYEIPDLDIPLNDDGDFHLLEICEDESGEHVYGTPSNICLGRFVPISDDNEKEINPDGYIECVYGPPSYFNATELDDDAVVDIFNPSED